MKSKSYILVISILFCMLPLISISGARQTSTESYYDRLKSLLGPKKYRITPKVTRRDVNLIEIEKGAAGVVYGASMDDVITIWGHPCELYVSSGSRDWKLTFGACQLHFIDNRLMSIGIHPATLPKAYLPNGISFESSYDEVKSTMGEPIRATDRDLDFRTSNGYEISFFFTEKNDIPSEAGKIVAITISHPDFE